MILASSFRGLAYWSSSRLTCANQSSCSLLVLKQQNPWYLVVLFSGRVPLIVTFQSDLRRLSPFWAPGELKWADKYVNWLISKHEVISMFALHNFYSWKCRLICPCYWRHVVCGPYIFCVHIKWCRNHGDRKKPTKEVEKEKKRCL